MRLIFYALITINLVFLGYLLFLEPQPVMTIPGPSPVSNGPTIHLLSERSGIDERRLEVAEVLRNPVTLPQDARAPGCQGLGPFEDILAAQNVSERLNATGVSVTLNAMDTPTGEFDYRVVMPPFPSLQDAFRRLRELKSRDIDSYVITQGEDAQGISLGVFSTELAAQSQQSFLADRGYQALIKQIPRLSRGYWVQASAGILKETDVAAFIEDFPEVSLTETACIN